MIYGYARVSSKGQELYGNGLDVQCEQLKARGAEKIFCESFTGMKKCRPELDKLMEIVESGDVVYVTKLDRIARSVRDGIAIIDELVEKGVQINILNMGVFDNTPNGKLMMSVMFAFAEFERDMIVQRTQEGKEIARQNGTLKEGRKRKELVDFDAMYKKVESGIESVSSACEKMKISRSTWYNRVNMLKTV